MMAVLEKKRLSISVLIGVVLSLIVGLIWKFNSDKFQASLDAKVKMTSRLVVQQFGDVLSHNVDRLKNLKSRLEVTKGKYFDYWNQDAARIIDQDPSFFFVEWIDSTGVIQRVEPKEGNQEALGLNILKLDYRKSDWNKARRDSVFNLTHWLELVQGDFAFLVDAPVYVDGDFYGTITAGMDFSTRFDAIMQGLEQYHVEIRDERGTLFYTYGDSVGTQKFQKLAVSEEIVLKDANKSSWTVKVVPNHLFATSNDLSGHKMILILALILCVLFAVSFFFMQKSSAAEKSYKQANQKLRALIDSAPTAIFVVDKDGVVVDFWNNAAENMLGWKKEAVMGMPIPCENDEYKQEFMGLINKCFKNDTVINYELVRERKDGSEAVFRVDMGAVGDKQEVLVLMEDITKEKKYEHKIEKSLDEKKILLAEIHHRVKNNLAIIVGLIELHKDEVKDNKTSLLLNETQNRIYTISGVHELLYNTESFSEISFEEYIEKLISRVQQTYQGNGNRVSINRNFNNFSVNINQAIPVGLLLNELITNSYKHAFDSYEEAEIFFEVQRDNGSITITYEDNGKGVDKSLFVDANTLGITLIKTLLAQLDAEYSIESNSGFRITFQFEAREKGSHSNF